MNSPYGQIAWWGFSPSIDLIDYMKKHEVEHNGNEINVLMVGASDYRHLLNTLSQLYGFDGKINVYMAESSMENVARQMLMTKLALEDESDHNIQEKSEMFLELFGNSLIRSDTRDYLAKNSNTFIEMVTEPSYAKEHFSYFDFTHLKFKERDQLEAIFKFWRNPNEKVFDVVQLWDERVRGFLGVRYDGKDNAFDWEYSMNLKGKASIVNWHEYKKWRDNGVAFTVRDESAYTCSNKSLASGLIFKKGDGERIPKRGYWGDIINSPYIAFGVQSKKAELFEKANKVHKHTSTDVSLYNVKSCLHQIVSGEVFSENNEPTITEISEEEEIKEVTMPMNKNLLDKFKIIFLPLECVGSLHRKSKFKRRFDMVYFSNSMVHYLDSSISELFRSKQSIMVIESTKFMLDVKEEMHKEYGKKITNMAKTAKCELCKAFDSETNEYAVFKFEGE